HRVPDQDRPQKVLRVLKVSIQPCGRLVALPHLLRDPPPAQRENPSFHPRAHERSGQAKRQNDEQIELHYRFTTSISSSRTRRSSTRVAVNRNPFTTAHSRTAGTYSNSFTNKPPIVSTSSSGRSAGYSRRNSSIVQIPFTRHLPVP